MGVDLFFVLSGFLITGVLLANRDVSGRAWSFYGRRVLRIFPLYYGIIISLLLLPRLGATWRELEIFRQLQPWYWLHATNWLTLGLPITQVLPAGTAAMWSRRFEEQFYLLSPAIVWQSSSAQIRRLAAMMLGIGLLSRLGR